MGNPGIYFSVCTKGMAKIVFSYFKNKVTMGAFILKFDVLHFNVFQFKIDKKRFISKEAICQ